MPSLAQGLILPRAPTGPAGIAEILQRGAEDIVVLAFPTVSISPRHTIIVPGGYWYRPIAIHADLLTDANVGNRRIKLPLWNQDGVHVLTLGAGPSQGAGIKRSHAFAVSVQVAVNITDGTEPSVNNMADIIIPSGWRINVEISLPFAGDRIQNVTYFVERYPTGVREPSRPPAAVPARLIEQASVFALAPAPPPEGEQPPPVGEQPPPVGEEQPPEGEQPPPEEQPPERPSLPPLPPIQERAVGAEDLRRRLEEEAARRRRVPVREPGEIPRGRPLAE